MKPYAIYHASIFPQNYEIYNVKLFIFLRDLFKLVDCNQKYPIQNVHRLGFLKNFIANPNIQVGDFTYYDDPDGIDNFETKNVLYHFDFVGDKLIIGKFCQLATGVRFIMNGVIF